MQLSQAYRDVTWSKFELKVHFSIINAYNLSLKKIPVFTIRPLRKKYDF